MSPLGVRRAKAALFQWVQIPPGERFSRKQPEQFGRERLYPAPAGFAGTLRERNHHVTASNSYDFNQVI